MRKYIVILGTGGCIIVPSTQSFGFDCIGMFATWCDREVWCSDTEKHEIRRALGFMRSFVQTIPYDNHWLGKDS